MADIKRRAPHYVSDWTDAFLPANRGRCLSSVAFLFFACLAPAIAFGALFAEYTNDQLGATEMILSSAISGVAYAFLSGQPLCILGATGTCPKRAIPGPPKQTSVQFQTSFLFPLTALPIRIHRCRTRARVHRGVLQHVPKVRSRVSPRAGVARPVDRAVHLPAILLRRVRAHEPSHVSLKFNFVQGN